MRKRVIITTGPMGSGNHLFSKILNLHPDVKGWEEINSGEYKIHRDEPYNLIWRDPSAIDRMDWEGDYHTISISCPYMFSGKPLVPKYKEAIEKLLSKGFDVHIGIIGRDKNILELQQTRIRGENKIDEFLNEVEYLTTLPHTFLSHEMAVLYKVDYVKAIGKQMNIPVVHDSPQYEKIFGVNSNRSYVTQIREGVYDKDIADRRQKGRAWKAKRKDRMRILVAGLPGSGKTTLADHLYYELLKYQTCVRINADEVRAEMNNWDFSIEGRLKQVNELVARSEAAEVDIVICDFIAPTKEIRDIYAADYVIWMDTVKHSSFEDTNELFQPVEDADYIVTDFDDSHISRLVDSIKSWTHTKS